MTCSRSGQSLISFSNFGNSASDTTRHLRPAVGQHEAVVVLGEQRVDRHGDNAGLEAAEKRDRPVHGVEQRHQHALFAVDAQAAQRSAETRHPVGELADRSACAGRRCKPAFRRGRQRDCVAGHRRRNCNRVGLGPRARPRCRPAASPRRLSLFFLPDNAYYAPQRAGCKAKLYFQTATGSYAS